MDRLSALIATIEDEDRRLRGLVQTWPPEGLERAGRAGGMSPKETLGHLAFWDAFTVRFFEARLSGVGDAPLDDFEARDRHERKQLQARPFAAVLAAYSEATAALVCFLAGHWRDLSDHERAEFVTPLRHRRHHRLLLARALVEIAAPRAAEQNEGSAAH